MPLCDSSETYMRAVRPKPSPAELRPGLTADISEVSRFSCMKFLGVSGVFDYAGLIRNSRYRPCSCCLPRIYTASASGLYLFAAPSPTPPILYLRFTASLTVAAQDSRPSGSLLLSRKALSSSTFMPVYPGAHKSPLHSLTLKGGQSLGFIRTLVFLQQLLVSIVNRLSAGQLDPGCARLSLRHDLFRRRLWLRHSVHVASLSPLASTIIR